MTPSVQHFYNMRSGKRKRYAKKTYGMAHIMHHAVKQVPMKRDLNKWWKRPEDAVSKELNQFHMGEAFLPIDPYQIIEEENIMAMEHLLLLEGKAVLFY